MKNVRNSCSGRGCSVRIILPNDGKSGEVFSKMHGRRNAIQALLPIFNIPLDKMASEKR